MAVVFSFLIALAFGEDKYKPAHSIEEYKRDYSYLCEISKLFSTLSNKPEFKKHGLELAVTQVELLHKVIVTKELKTTINSVYNLSKDNRIELIHQSAREVGLKNWRCNSLQ